MKYVIKNTIGYIADSEIKGWHKDVQTKKEAKKFNSKEEAEQYLETHFCKRTIKFMTIEKI